MKIAIALDETLVDADGAHLRPGMRELLLNLKDDGHNLILFTFSPYARARDILQKHHLTALFDRLVTREDYDPDGEGRIKDLASVGADALIDDDPAQVEAARASGRPAVNITPFTSSGDEEPADLDAIRRAMQGPPLDGWVNVLRDGP